MLKQMILNNFSGFYRISFFLFFLVFSFGISAQEKATKKIDSTQVSVKTIAIGDVPNETEKLNHRILELRTILKPSTPIKEVDSLLNKVAFEIGNKKDSLLVHINILNNRQLKSRKVAWANYKSTLKNYQEVLKKRIEDIGDITEELLTEKKRWKQTKKNLISNAESTKAYDDLDQIVEMLDEVIKIAHLRLDNLFEIQKGMTELVLTVDETISEIELTEIQLQKNYFVFDSSPLWKSKNIQTTAIDSAVVKPIKNTTLILSGLQENKTQLQEFFSLNSKTAILQIIFITLLFILIVRLNKWWEKQNIQLTKPVEIQTKIILSHSLSTTMVIGLFISAFFYEALIPVFSELHIFLILIGTIILLPKITVKSFRSFLILIFVVYIIQTFSAYLDSKSELARWLIILRTLILILAFEVGKRVMRKAPEQFIPVYKLFKIITPIYILVLIIVIIANIIGMVNLSKFLFTGVLVSTVLLMVVFLALKIITSLIILFLNFRKYSIQALSSMVKLAHKRLFPVFNIIGLIVWLIFTLKGFDVLSFIVSWFNELMTIKWMVGEMTISLGGILSFSGIFIVAIILAKLAATIFQDEWMVKTLPRGVAPAISLLLRILIIGIGFYMALSSAGIDLSNLGFMFGALGVGIGFGLQNVVLNFVAGLILAFERPINLGDTIEVDQELGIVTNIGVRSSNIKSYSGYEAIIPNGDLISKKVINYTLSNRDRRSKILMKTAPSADPEKVISLLNQMAEEDARTVKEPAPKTYFYGYDSDGNLSFALLYWTTFSDTLKTDSAISLKIFAKLNEEGIQAPVPVRRIIKED